jgi:hypothetical protein
MLRFRLLALIGIALSTFVLFRAEYGDSSLPREWRDGQGPSLVQIQDAPRAAQRWVMGLHLDAQWRVFSGNVEKRVNETMPAVQDALSMFRVD